ncbi:MAG: hypothetical protein V4474_02825 [Patescibacteria group bacterium]
MFTFAIALTLVAVCGMTVEGLLRKVLLNHKAFTERELLVTKCGIAALVSWVWYLCVGGTWNALAPQHFNLPLWLAALAVVTALNVVIQFTNVRMTRIADVSFVTPLAGMTPGLVIGSALLIGERPGWPGIVGVALIMIGTYTHLREGAPLREYFMPLYVWRAVQSTAGLPPEEQKKRRVLRLAYLGALCSTVALIGDGLVGRHGDVTLAVALELSALCGIFTLFPHTAKGEGVFVPFHARFVKHGGTLVALGVAFAVPFIMLGLAFRLAPIADIAALKRLAIFGTVVGGVWLLGERQKLRRVLLAGIIVAGAMFIAFDPAPAVILESMDQYLMKLTGR